MSSPFTQINPPQSTWTIVLNSNSSIFIPYPFTGNSVPALGYGEGGYGENGYGGNPAISGTHIITQWAVEVTK